MWANTLFGSDLIPRGVLDDLGPEKIYCIDQLVTFRAHVHMGGGGGDGDGSCSLHGARLI